MIAPKPRAPYPSEKTYLTTNPDGSVSSPKQLPCWYDRWRAQDTLDESYPTIPEGFPVPDAGTIEPAELEISVVVPAYNEEERLAPALEEMVEYLDRRFGRPNADTHLAPSSKVSSPATPHRLVFKNNAPAKSLSGYEIIIVNDGSKDRTVDVALDFSKKRGLHDILRVVTLEKNRGKGGGVTHGFRHVRGEYVIFADADGASKFSDLGKLIEGVEDVVDGSNRGVAIGSRAHLVGSEAVVKVSLLCFPPFLSPSLANTSPLNQPNHTALRHPQLSHAILPLYPHDSHAAGYVSHTGHAMRFQALLARGAASHHSVHALGGLDF